MIHVVLQVIISIILALGCLMAILGNPVILFVILCSPSLHDPSGYLIANLAMADFGIGVLVMPFVFLAVAINNNQFIRHWLFCNILAVFNSFFISASILSIVTITIDRLLAVALPLRYFNVVTITKVKIAIIMIWLFSLFYAIIPIIGLEYIGLGKYEYVNTTYTCWLDWQKAYNNHFLLIIYCQVAILFITVVIGYIALCCMAKTSNRRIAAVNDTNKTEMTGNKNGILTKTTKTTFLIVGIFALCWLPSIIGVFISLTVDQELPGIVQASCTWLIMLNSSMNPIIYGVYNRQFRRGFRMCWDRMWYFKRTHSNISALTEMTNMSANERTILTKNNRYAINHNFDA